VTIDEQDYFSNGIPLLSRLFFSEALIVHWPMKKQTIHLAIATVKN